VELTTWLPKLTDVGDTLMSGATPVPSKLGALSPLAALLVNVKVAVLDPMADGVKSTCTCVELPGAIVVPDGEFGTL
jgi:hypothetical protein